MQKIFFIGLGKMGTPMSKNLIKEKYSVTIFDVNSKAYNNFKTNKVKLANSIYDIKDEYDVIMSMLPDGKTLTNIIFRDNKKLLNFIKKNTIWIDCSSIDYQATLKIYNTFKQQNIYFLDAPVSGGVTGAASGNLSIMVGGDKNIFYKSKKILECIGQNIYYMGSSGSGQIVKACNNMMLGINMLGISEAFTMAKKFGIAEKDFFKICSVSTSSSWAMLNHLPVKGIVKNSAANKNFKGGYAVKLMNKDLQISQAMAKKINLNTPLGKNAAKIYSSFSKKNNQNLDYASVIKALKKN